MISVIYVQHENAELTLDSLASLQTSQHPGYELILMDNGSRTFDQETFQKRFPEMRIMRNMQNEGFGRANNRAAREAHGDILLFLNNDTLCREEFTERVEGAFARDPGLGVLGPRLVSADGSFQLSAGWLPSFWKEIADRFVHTRIRRRNRWVQGQLERAFSRRRRVGWVTGAALFIRAELFRRLGGFDEDLFMYFEDKDICKRASDGGAMVVYDPSFTIVHLKGGSSSPELSAFLAQTYRRSQERYYARHRPPIEQALLRAYLTTAGKSPHG